jgi:hypothetical protein
MGFEKTEEEEVIPYFSSGIADGCVGDGHSSKTSFKIESRTIAYLPVQGNFMLLKSISAF